VLISLSVQSVSKSFSDRSVLRAISFEAREHEIIGVAGRNGAGKSTLVKIIGGILTPDKGKVELHIENTAIDPDEYYKYIGFAAPYIPVYDEFSPYELLKITAKLRNIPWSDALTDGMMDRFGLAERKEATHSYSSGMMQRIRLAAAIQHTPALLILDEPTTNLDERGIAIVRKIIEEQSGRGVVVLASNNPAELDWCGKTINVETK